MSTPIPASVSASFSPMARARYCLASARGSHAPTGPSLAVIWNWGDLRVGSHPGGGGGDRLRHPPASRVIAVTNNLETWRESGLHYISVTLLAEVDGEPQLLEPEKCEGWIWCDPHTLPEPHFDASRQSIACWLAGQCYLPQAQPAPDPHRQAAARHPGTSRQLAEATSHPASPVDGRQRGRAYRHQTVTFFVILSGPG